VLVPKVYRSKPKTQTEGDGDETLFVGSQPLRFSEPPAVQPAPNTNQIDPETEETDILSDFPSETYEDTDLKPNHYLTHYPMNSKCKVCQASKLKRRQARRRSEPIQVEKYGSLVSFDHIVFGAVPGFGGESVCLIGRDTFSMFGIASPSVQKDGESSFSAIQDLVGDEPTVSVRVDSSRELAYAVERLKLSRRVNVSLSAPYRSTSNSLQERFGQELIRGTRALLRQAGLPESFWPFAIVAFVAAYNCQVQPNLQGVPPPCKSDTPITT
jgi:hypothetical protein